jgi:NADH:ubiquinone oxidoreductase subunit E
MLAFSENTEAQFQELVARYPEDQRQAALLPTLWLARRSGAG